MDSSLSQGFCHRGRAVGRYLEVERDVAVGRTEAEEGFAERGEHRAGIAAELGAEMLRAVEDPGPLEEVDTAIDLVHVALAERIERELGGDANAEHRRGGDRGKCRLD